MKKTKLLLFPFLFSVIFFLLMLHPDARILSGETHGVFNSDSFNLLAGYSCIKDGDTEDYEHYNYYISEKIGTATLTNICFGSVLEEEATIKEVLCFEDGYLSAYSYFFNDELFYEAEVDYGYDLVNVKTDKEIDLPLLYDDPAAVFCKSSVTTDYFRVLDNLGSVFSDTLSLYAFSFTMAGTYKVNDEYEDEDVHIVMDCENPLTFEEILESIHVYDNVDGITTWTDNNTYDKDNLVMNEVYSFRYLASDSSGNVTAQVFFVEARDVTAPHIDEASSYIEVSYSDPLSEEDFKILFPAHDTIDEDEDLIYVFDLSEYEAHARETGDYAASVYVSDTSGNKTDTISFVIHVKDDVAPTLAYASEYDTNTDTEISMEDIRRNISAVDALDGDISSYVVITEDTYTENQDKPGTYSVSFSVTDSSGNSSYGIIIINVYDEEYPVITISRYAVFTKKGTAVTKEQVIELFKSLGYEMTEESLESEAFDKESLDGEYDLTITESGLPTENVITTEECIGVSYEIPSVTKKKNHTVLIVVLSVSAVILLSSASFGVVLYKKKH